jgi:hypothetical protein
MSDPTLKRWHDMMANGQGVEAAMEIIRSVGTGTSVLAIPHNGNLSNGRM